MKIHTALEMNRAAEKNSGRHNHASAACVVACLDGRSKRSSVIRLTTCDRTVRRHIKISRWKDGRLDAGDDAFSVLPRVRRQALRRVV